MGGKGILKMEDLRKVFEKAGAKAVRTHIQSGNVLFQAEKGQIEAIRAKIGGQLKKILGREPVVIYRTEEELVRLVKAEPFKKYAGDAAVKCYVVLLEAGPNAKLKLPLAVEKEALELLRWVGRDLLVLGLVKKDGHFGFPNAWVEKTLGVAATSRNWNTVVKMAGLAGEPATD